MSSAVVVDASVVVKWFLDEPDSSDARRLSLLRLHAPALLLAECGNVLWLKTKSGDCTPEEALEVLHGIYGAPVSIAPDHRLAKPALDLAVKLNHPIYDCMYLALARDLAIPCITADLRFVRAVRKAALSGVEVLALSETSGLMNELRQ